MSQLPPQTSSLFPVDLSYAHDIVDGDVELLQEIVDLFILDYPFQLAALQQAITAQDAADIQAKAHRLKCSFGNIGGWEAYKLAYELELMGMRGELGHAAPYFQELVVGVEAILAFLAQPGWVELAQDWQKGEPQQ